MLAKDLLNQLLDGSVSVADKAQTWGEYIRWYEKWGASTGLEKRAGRLKGLEEFQASLPRDDHQLASDLEKVLASINEDNEEKKRSFASQTKSIADKLRSLKPGTPVVVQDQDLEWTVTFLEMKRTRVLGVDPDGKKFSIPVQLFLRVQEGVKPKNRKPS